MKSDAPASGPLEWNACATCGPGNCECPGLRLARKLAGVLRSSQMESLAQRHSRWMRAHDPPPPRLCSWGPIHPSPIVSALRSPGQALAHPGPPVLPAPLPQLAQAVLPPFHRALTHLPPTPSPRLPVSRDFTLSLLLDRRLPFTSLAIRFCARRPRNFPRQRSLHID